MDVFSSIISFGTKVWNYCSPECQNRAIAASVEEMKRKVMECPRCAGLNGNNHPAGNLTTSDDQCARMCGDVSNRNDLTYTVHRPSDVVPLPSRNGPACRTQIHCQGNNCQRICCRPGKITNNPFFNYVRTVRPAHCGQQQTVLVQKAALEWNRKTPDEKAHYTKRAVYGNRVRNTNHG